jgi:hypothetical protein
METFLATQNIHVMLETGGIPYIKSGLCVFVHNEISNYIKTHIREMWNSFF